MKRQVVGQVLPIRTPPLSLPRNPTMERPSPRVNSEMIGNYGASRISSLSFPFSACSRKHARSFHSSVGKIVRLIGKVVSVSLNGPIVSLCYISTDSLCLAQLSGDNAVVEASDGGKVNVKLSRVCLLCTSYFPSEDAN